MNLAAKLNFDQRLSAQIASFIADAVLLIYGIYSLATVDPGQNRHLGQHESNILFYLIVISVVPWYMGYLLHHFSHFTKVIRLIFQWFFALITLGLIVFLVLTFMPYVENKDTALSGFQTFLIAFGMFFLVLGPMMIIGGYSDAEALDQVHDITAPIRWPIVTFTMLIITASILFMVLIIGLFDPTWSGKSSFLVVILGFLGGPVLAVVACIPFILLGKWIERADRYRIIPKLIALSIPTITFIALVWWNDIVIEQIRMLTGLEKPKLSTVLWSVFLAGIIPFRLILLFKPPFKWTALVSGIFALGIYIWSLIQEYGA